MDVGLLASTTCMRMLYNIGLWRSAAGLRLRRGMGLSRVRGDVVSKASWLQLAADLFAGSKGIVIMVSFWVLDGLGHEA